MKNIKDENWSSEFNYSDYVTQEDTPTLDFKEDILNDSYGAFNKFYQKETKRSKAPKKCKPAWQ